MYTFYPLVGEPVSHFGFYLLLICSLGIFITSILEEPDLLIGYFFAEAFFILFVYCCSFVWTDQEVKVYKNEKVVGEFMGYAPEGYREKTGKYYSERHYVYVIYGINGDPVLMQATAGVVYPKRAILYKN